MSSQCDSSEPPTAEENKRFKHAEAQCRYRERKLEETRAKARERMAQLRGNHTPEQVRAAAEKRRPADAEHREVVRRRKFRETYGEDTFFDLYIPQYALQGVKHLPYLRLDPADLKKKQEEQAEHEEREKRQWAQEKRARREAKKARAKKAAESHTKSHYSDKIGMARISGDTWDINHRRPCEAAFFPDDTNFDGRKTHDQSKRKMYFVVPWKGIFTKLSDALAWVECQDDIDPALTMKKAIEIMDAYCARHHQHGEVVPDSEDERSATPAVNLTSPAPSRPLAKASPSRSPSPSKTTSAPSKLTPVRSNSKPAHSTLNLNSDLNFKAERKFKIEPASPTAANVKIERGLSVKREGLKREVSPPSPKRSLFADDTDDEVEVEVEVGNKALDSYATSHNVDMQERAEQDERDSDNVEHMLSLYLDDNVDTDAAESTSRKRSVSVPPRDSQPKHARGGHFPSSPSRATPSAPRADISPTISSVSSMSTASYTSVAHPFRDLGESASTARRGGVPASPRKTVPSPAVSAPTPRSTSSPRRGAAPTAPAHRPSRPASVAPRQDATIHLGPGALRDFGGSGEPMQYKPTELKKILEDRVPGTPSVHVFINNATCTIYRDTDMAVREMAPTETVKVVDVDEVEEYISTRRWAV
ncbi:hypothetical protein C8R43DRAFT_960083 [Mycena crocata]|nr:hypothetical protein C8R43DRAFT_960083 [Mycena crocata]